MSVQSYAYNDKTQITKNFNVSEFKCKCGKVHNIKLSTELVNKLQQMTDLVGADYVIITSGHRCSTHDRNVGGSGTGPHVDGYAADCKFVKNNKAISTKLLSCVAQDMGFNGIANITNTYEYIHLDMKGRRYYGNEIINYNTVTSDFYSYYGISKSQVNELTNNKNTQTVTVEIPINKKDKVSVDINFPITYDEKIKELQKILFAKGYRNVGSNGIATINDYNVLRKFTIEKNDRGPLTRWVQERLNQMGYDCSIADGIAGQETMNGIKAMQKDYNLGQGYLGGSDWLVLLKWRKS